MLLFVSCFFLSSCFCPVLTQSRPRKHMPRASLAASCKALLIIMISGGATSHFPKAQSWHVFARARSSFPVAALLAIERMMRSLIMSSPIALCTTSGQNAINVNPQPDHFVDGKTTPRSRVCCLGLLSPVFLASSSCPTTSSATTCRSSTPERPGAWWPCTPTTKSFRHSLPARLDYQATRFARHSARLLALGAKHNRPSLWV